MGDRMILEIQERLNNRPRKCLNYRKPNETFATLLKKEKGHQILELTEHLPFLGSKLRSTKSRFFGIAKREEEYTHVSLWKNNISLTPPKKPKR